MVLKGELFILDLCKLCTTFFHAQTHHATQIHVLMAVFAMHKALPIHAHASMDLQDSIAKHVRWPCRELEELTSLHNLWT